MEQRVNIYGFPHKGIRYGLGQLSYKVGSLILNDIEALKLCKEITDDLSELLDLQIDYAIHNSNKFITTLITLCTMHSYPAG